VAPNTSRLTVLWQYAAVLAVSGLLFAFGGWLAVRLAVSGPETRVPDVRGLSAEAARQQLEAAGMSPVVEPERLVDETLPANHVVRQVPSPGTPLKRIRTVTLMLSTGPRERTLPTMVGDSRSRALIALEQQGFEVDYVAVAPSTEVARDTIIAQEPDPAELPPGVTAPLRLLASLGPPVRYYVMVDLIGREAAAVRPYLEGLGFRVAEGPNRRVIANVPPGTIVMQTPSAGFRVAEGGEIVLQVSR
jgi:serine/threonine-protein kinase